MQPDYTRKPPRVQEGRRPFPLFPAIGLPVKQEDPPLSTPAAAAEPPRLFGFDETPGVVAVEVSEREATLLRAVRDGSGWSDERLSETRPFRPWLLLGGQ